MRLKLGLLIGFYVGVHTVSKAGRLIARWLKNAERRINRLACLRLQKS